MTVKELKEALSKYPDNMEVFVAPRVTEFKYGLGNSVRSEEIRFTEDPFPDDEYDGLEGLDTVVIIDEQ